MDSPLVWVIVPLALVAWLAATLPIVRVVFRRFGGGQALAQRYSVRCEPSGQRFERQTVVVGAVRYRRCSTVIINSEGLYFSSWFYGTPLFIPWTEITGAWPARLYGQPALKLLVGSPLVGTITVHPGLFEPMRPYLDRTMRL